MSNDIRKINDDLDTLCRVTVLHKELRSSLNDASRLVTELRMALAIDPTTPIDDVIKAVWDWEKIVAAQTAKPEAH